MKYRPLGRSGIKISQISLGGWLTFGGTIDDDKAGQALIDRAFDLGINFFDTANIYARGKCEEMWGRLLKNHRRDSFVLGTKVFAPMDDGPNDRGLSRKHIMEQCHHSLRRLQTDYIDLYQCHRYDDETPIEETVRAMDDLIHQGKVHYWGFSEWTPENIQACLKVCREGGYYRPVSSQPQYSIIYRNWEKEVFPLCLNEGIGQVCWSPLGQGLLTGKYKPGQEPPKGSRSNQYIQENSKDDKLLERIQKLAPIAKEAGCTMTQLALAWILRLPVISCAIVGATKISQLEENAAASEIELPPEIIAKIEKVWPLADEE